VFDGPGGSQRRRKLFPDYKKKRRTTKDRYNRRDDIDSDDNSKWQLSVILKLLEQLPITYLIVPSVEADDVISVISNHLQKSNIYIMSTDKDFMQLIDERISVWSPMKKRHYTIDRVKEEFGVHPNNFILQKIITGDDSDCIPGIERFGAKTVNKYFPKLIEEQTYEIDNLFE